MDKLVIVSNRVAPPIREPEAGGLAVALHSALEKKGGIWCGWSGQITQTPERHTDNAGNVEYITQDLSQEEYEQYYLEFSNSTLWPLFHYRTDLIHFSQTAFDTYDRVNARFAETLSEHADESDTIWVHDYHLLTLGKHLRHTQLSRGRIGFFLHIPFPSPEIFRILPLHKMLLSAMMEYDLIGFQTKRDMWAFTRCITDLGGGTIHNETDKALHLEAFGKSLKVGVYPISIDTGNLQRLAKQASVKRGMQKFQAQFNNGMMMLGVDRLDYTKGIPARMQAYDRFLRTHPEHKEKLTYVQIAPTSRSDVGEYRQLREQVEGLVAHINGEHGEIDWVPIRYINKSYSHRILSGFYRMSKIGLVTPLCDGMNLVAKEYVACQDPEDPGVLVLSEFAGAGDELAEGALFANPYDPEGMAEKIKQAATMPLEERQHRHHAMMQVLHDHTIYDWSGQFLSDLRHKPAFEPVVIKSQSRHG